MFHVKHSADDTIAAIATPPGQGGIGVIRLSGPDAKSLAARLFVPRKPVASLESHKLYHGWIEASGSKVDEVLLSYMPGPGSYTGEDVVEVSCHGGGLVIRKILGLFVEQGARLAEKGEFTKRAFLNGRLDLLQAEAVADLISAKSERGLRAAAAQLGGAISGSVNEVRQTLLDLVAELEAAVDFPEDIEAPSGPALTRKLAALIDLLSRLIATADEGRLVREGVRTVIIGKPNVGKSSLLNQLMAADRAIVSEVPGTTRDTIEESVSIDGLAFVLVDTAGLRMPKDELEAAGIGRTGAAIDRADLALIVLDASQDLSEEDEAVLARGLTGRAVVVLNKIDLGAKLSLNGRWGHVDKYPVSALTGEGLDSLKAGLVGLVLGQGQGALNELPALINARHKEALWRAKEALERAGEALSADVASDLVTIDLKSAIGALGEVTGQEVTDQIIENIFRRFCVGK